MIAPKKRLLIVPHRRRREGKTDYKQRLQLLESRQDRFIVRRSVNGISCQVVRYKKDGDFTEVSATSRELHKHGWRAGTGNLPAAYLVGYLCAVKAKKKKINNAILDIGLQKSVKGCRIYAALKGAVDGGLTIPHSPEIFPDNDRATGKHIADYAAALKAEDPKKYERVFTAYLKHNLVPEHMQQYVEKAKESMK